MKNISGAVWTKYDVQYFKHIALRVCERVFTEEECTDAGIFNALDALNKYNIISVLYMMLTCLSSNKCYTSTFTIINVDTELLYSIFTNNTSYTDDHSNNIVQAMDMLYKVVVEDNSDLDTVDLLLHIFIEMFNTVIGDIYMQLDSYNNEVIICYFSDGTLNTIVKNISNDS